VPLSYTALVDFTFAICPHQRLHPEMLSDPKFSHVDFPRQIQTGFLSVEQEKKSSPAFYSCRRCPTDYIVDIREEFAYIYTWQDFGDGKWEDETWYSQTSTRSNNHTTRGGLTFDRKQGSVQSLVQRYIASKNMSRSKKLFGDCPPPPHFYPEIIWL
jgi:hypothetical protein